MRYLKIKDKKLRKLYLKLELKLKLNKFILINTLSYISSLNLNKNLVYYQLLKKKRKNILNKIVRRCVLTNRSKSVQFLKISRLQAKEMIAFGIVPGYKKGIW
jgi:ribosomal protein S14